ncbi:MAG: DegT/DnrJ/EryC1/StrS family aminotransferase [Desulfobacterales bacterium]|nr:DegT/DnrJ/EryC1/StrS family aminotransferase [Desulfobacterales bacterium]
MSDGKMKLGIIIPVYGNEKSLITLYQRINDALRNSDVVLTIYFVNDRSPDNSQKVLEDLAAQDTRVNVVLLSKNHGSFVAIYAGLNYARDNDAVIMLAADLQDPPEVIPEMIKKWREGYPVVLCVRRNRSDSFGTKIFSTFFNRLYRKFIMPDMPAGGFDFCLIDQRVADVIIKSAEKNTSLVGLIIWSGFERAYIPYDRAERVHGKSMWSFRKKVRYAINSVISFSSLPLKWFSFLGIFLSIICFLGIIITLYNYFSGRIPVSGWTSLILVILFLGSFQFLAFGILGEYFWNNLEQSRNRPLFIVDKKIDGNSLPATDSAPRESNQMVPFFDIKTVSSPVAQSLKESAGRVIEGPQIILGSAVAKFENELANYTGLKHAVGVGNGTDALTLALWAAGINPGDRVITTSLSAPATAVAILRAGATPFFVDVDETYLTISPEQIEKAATQGAKAIIPVHLYGNPCPMDVITEIAEKYNLAVIEDCAQSFGTTINGAHCGSYSIAAAFSFYPTKNLGAYGDGGAVMTNDTSIFEDLKLMRFYGQDASGQCVRQGINSRLDEIQAALLSERLKIIERQNNQRVKIMKTFDQALPFLNPVPALNGRIPHLYVVRPSDRESFRKFLLDNQIQTGVHYPIALPNHSYIKKHSIAEQFSAAENACQQVVSLPCLPGMSDAHVEKIIDVCRKWESQAS